MLARVRLVEIFVAGIVASAWYAARRRRSPVRSAYPRLGGDFAL